jgi:hypothetical protein
MMLVFLWEKTWLVLKLMLAIKQIEISRVVDFRENNPDMFLPADLDISHEGLESVAA